MPAYAFEARRSGAVTLHISTVSFDVEIHGDAHRDRAVIELHTEDTDGPLIHWLEMKRPYDRGDLLELDLTDLPLGNTNCGGVQYGDNNVQNFTFNGYISGDDDRGYDMGGHRGHSMINGFETSGLRVVAWVPRGSTALVESVTGDVAITGVPRVHTNTTSGDVQATGLIFDSSFDSVSGGIVIGAGEDATTVPVTAKTVSGDLLELTDRLALRFRTVSGSRRSLL